MTFKTQQTDGELPRDEEIDRPILAGIIGTESFSSQKTQANKGEQEFVATAGD